MNLAGWVTQVRVLGPAAGRLAETWSGLGFTLDTTILGREDWGADDRRLRIRFAAALEAGLLLVEGDVSTIDADQFELRARLVRWRDATLSLESSESPSSSSLTVDVNGTRFRAETVRRRDEYRSFFLEANRLARDVHT